MIDKNKMDKHIKKEQRSIKKSRGNYQNRLKWWIIFIIFWVVFYLVFSFTIFTVNYFIIGIIFLIFGILGTVLNWKLYEYMVKLNIWGFGKMGISEIERGIRSGFYRKFYRIVTFLVGLLALLIGIFYIFLHFGVDLRTLF